MSATGFVSYKSGRIIFSLTTVFALLCCVFLAVNLFKVSRTVDISKKGSEFQVMPDPISHEKYESLLASFREPYTPSGAHKRNIFSQSQVPQTQVSHITEPPVDTDFKDIRSRIRVTKIYQKPVKLLFKGYIQLAGDVYVATINWGEKTDFKKVGEVIRGYKVSDFKKNVTEQKTPWGGTEKVDQSVITLERDGQEKFNLEIGKITLEKEIYAELWDRKEAKSFEVYIGSEILQHKVLDISNSQVIIMSPKGEKIALVKETETP